MLASFGEQKIIRKMLPEPTPVDINSPHASVTERYYTPKYKIDVVRKGEDHQVLLHSNRVCVVTLAESHPILAEKKTVTKVDFQVDKKTNRLKNKVSGKGKKGAQWLQDESPLCRATCSDGSTYTIRACINASLLEVNHRLVDQPHLLNEKPNSSGYVALTLTGLKEHERVIGRLLSKEQYKEAILARNTAADKSTAPESSTQDANSDITTVETKETVEDATNNTNLKDGEKVLDKIEEISNNEAEEKTADAKGLPVESSDLNCTDNQPDGTEPCCKKPKLENE